MRCGVGAEEGEIGSGGDYSFIMRTCASIDHGGRSRPTAATGPHSWLLLFDRITSLKLEKVIINYVN